MVWASLVFFLVITVITTESRRVSEGGMLAVQATETRDLLDLSGIWTFKFDSDNVGIQEKWWTEKLKPPTMPMPVPSSYNDVVVDDTIRKHIGWVWYENYFRIPSSYNGRRVVLRFESVCYYALVWFNGEQVTEHYGGHLPFEVDISQYMNVSSLNRIVVAVNNTLTPSTLPPGDIVIYSGNNFYPKGYTVQMTYFDFFNYAGIDRPVYVYTTPQSFIDDITLNFQIEGNGASVLYNVSVLPSSEQIDLRLLDSYGNVVSTATGSIGTLSVNSDDLQLWEPGNPYLYTLEVTSGVNTPNWDIYRLTNVGIRTISVTPSQFLLNNKPFYFHGVDRHEDSDMRGKGFDRVLLVRDFNLMNWMNVNAFRTSHYPYSREFYDMADQYGIVIIDESPAVGLKNANYFNNETLEHHKDVMYEIIRRDKNHPSVVMWSIANEPDSSLSVAYPYFKEVSEFTKAIDPTNRPITMVQDQDYTSENCAEFFDVICVNRYYGWYSDSGALDLIQYQLLNDLDGWYNKYKKPIIVSEYGADTLVDLVSIPTYLFTSDFQTAFMHEYHEAFDQRRSQYLIGELVWNFADFATGPQVTRVGELNRKGVFTRQRQPKPAAYDLKNRYANLTDWLFEKRN